MITVDFQKEVYGHFLLLIPLKLKPTREVIKRGSGFLQCSLIYFCCFEGTVKSNLNKNHMAWQAWIESCPLNKNVRKFLVYFPTWQCQTNHNSNSSSFYTAHQLQLWSLKGHTKHQLLSSSFSKKLPMNDFG